MSYQTRLIKAVIKDQLSRRGIMVKNDWEMDQMIAKKIIRLNIGDHIAVEVDDFGILRRIEKIDGLDCLHSISDTAMIIPFYELERYFNEQQSISVQF